MSLQWLIRRSGGSVRALDPDVVAWRDAVNANGGSVSLARLIIVDQFVYSERASGAYALTDDYWGFWAENSAQALTSLKQRRLATAVNSPVFTTDREWAFDGATSYLNTGFIPSTHGIAYTADYQRLAVYERTNRPSIGSSAMGVSVATNNRTMIQPRATNSTMRGWMNTSGGTPAFALFQNNSQGFSAVSRANSPNTNVGYKNSVRLTDSTGLTNSSNIQNIAVFIGGQNTSGVAADLLACSVGFAAIGAPLSDAQEIAQYNAVQAWATAVGANV